MTDSIPALTTARAYLREARGHQNRARAGLDATPRDAGAALDAALDSIRASFRASLTAYGATPDPGAPLTALAHRAVRSNSTLKTAAHRATLLADRAPAIRQADRPSIHDREDAETGWYTARNLYQVVAGQLGAGPLPGHEAPDPVRGIPLHQKSGTPFGEHAGA